MNFELIPASLDYKNAIANLMQFYIYDFSEYNPIDVGDDGLFGSYTHFEEYWQQDYNRFPYLIKKEKKYAGFVFVAFIESGEQNYFSIAEFFIMKRFRRQGMGKAVAKKVFDLHKGKWEIFQILNNKPAQAFWHSAINDYTKGKFKERIENGRKIQDFES